MFPWKSEAFYLQIIKNINIEIPSGLFKGIISVESNITFVALYTLKIIFFCTNASLESIMRVKKAMILSSLIIALQQVAGTFFPRIFHIQVIELAETENVPYPPHLVIAFIKSNDPNAESATIWGFTGSVHLKFLKLFLKTITFPWFLLLIVEEKHHLFSNEVKY